MLKSYLELLKEKWSRFGSAGKGVLVIAGFVVAALSIVWLLDRLLFYAFAWSYVDEIARVFNLDSHLATAIALIVWVTILYLFSQIFSLTRRKRRFGILGLLVLLTGHGFLISQGSKNQFFETSGKATKCYVLTRDGEVRYLEHPGVDPVTGRTCRGYTQETIERLQAYSKGRRPERIFDPEPEFFDPRTGEPIIWFYRNKTGRIELFNFMGFDPESGEELQPVNAEIIASYKVQSAAQTEEAKRRIRPPQRIAGIEGYELFDTATGEPRVWFWRGPNGDYEFFDNQGFHPATGEALRQFTSEEIARWRHEKQLAKEYKEQEERKRLEQEQLRREAEERRLERERQFAEKAQQVEAERQRKLTEATDRCDQLAANPHDPRKPSNIFGSRYLDLKENSEQALTACRVVIEYFPNEPRYLYQYARALGFSKPDDAISIYQRLTKQGYPAAFDNLASLLLRRRDKKSIKQAIAILKDGVQAGDPDSMVTLVDWVGTEQYPAQNPVAVKLMLLRQAASLGDGDAKDAADELEQQIQQQQQYYASQREQEQIMLNLFGGIVGGVLRAR